MVILVYNALGKMKSQGMKVTDLAASLTNIEQAILATAPDNFGQNLGFPEMDAPQLGHAF